MLFIHPMWDSETQRIGMQKCHPLGYAMHAVGEFIGFIGLIFLLLAIGWMGYLWAVGKFSMQTWWLLTIPFGIGITSEAFVQLSWAMVTKHGFKYDAIKGESSWHLNGRRIVYAYQDMQKGVLPGSLSSISAQDIKAAIRRYTFPRSEKIFSYTLDNVRLPGIQWVCPAKPTMESSWDVADFWASSLYNCFDDYADNLFESLGEASVWETPANEPTLDDVIMLLSSEGAGTFRINKLIDYRLALRSGPFRGLIGHDGQNLISVIWKLANHADKSKCPDQTDTPPHQP